MLLYASNGEFMQVFSETKGNIFSNALPIASNSLSLEVLTIDISSDLAYMAMGLRNGLIQIWDIKENSLVKNVKDGHKTAVEKVAFWGPSYQTLLSCDISGNLEVTKLSKVLFTHYSETKLLQSFNKLFGFTMQTYQFKKNF